VTLDRALWQRARPLFDELVDLETDQRNRRLKQIGEEDPILRDALDRLLQADINSEDALRGLSFDSVDSISGPVTNSRDPLNLIGKTISHFTVTNYLAAGGMGVVYTAEDIRIGRKAALKFPLPDEHLDASLKERFMNEARSAGALDHPNLCTVYEVAESEHGVFLAMPLYPGETLKDRIARQGALPPDEALSIVQQMTTGLASAHAAGIIHRDLKPGNLMMLPGGTVKVLDFGLAKIRDVSMTRSHMALGTIGYASPEQVRGARVDARTDLWAIGVMFYEMLTGSLPFRGEHELSIIHGILHTDPPPPSAVNPSLSREFDKLVGGLLQKDVEARYQSADKLLADITAIRSGAALSHSIPFWSRTQQRRRIRRSLFPMIGVAALVVIAAAISNRYSRSVPAESSVALEFVNNTAVISTPAELVAALAPANAGRRIHLKSGTYDIDRPLIVPDGMSIEGESVMKLAADGHATGFADTPRTTLRMTGNVGGDLLTLGNNVTVRNVEIVDVNGRSGNVVAVNSRHPADTVSATIIESVIVNPNPLGIGAGGPLGRGLTVISRNTNLGAAPPPEENAMLTVRVLRSVIRAPTGGGGWFVYNFAANSRISFEISRSLIGGSDEANGGVSRTDAVHDSEVRLISQNNVYRNEWTDVCASPLLGWNLTGGSGAPIPLQLPETNRNRLLLESRNDRIEGFTTGILATGSRRFFGAPLNAGSNDNHIDLQLIGTTISTPICPSREQVGNTSGIPFVRTAAVADFQLFGAAVERSAIDAGNGNTVRVELRGVTGSGSRFNQFRNVGSSRGSVASKLGGKGNRLEIVGDPGTFKRTNRAIDPAPAPELFSGR
jgi:serine/threonine protein kinase